MAINGVHLAQVLLGTLPAILGLLAVLAVGTLLVMRTTSHQGGQRPRLVLEPMLVRVPSPVVNTPPAVLLRSALASRAPPGARPLIRPTPSSALRAEE